MTTWIREAAPGWLIFQDGLPGGEIAGRLDMAVGFELLASAAGERRFEYLAVETAVEVVALGADVEDAVATDAMRLMGLEVQTHVHVAWLSVGNLTLE